jgi:protein N-terminal methyltransferase
VEPIAKFSDNLKGKDGVGKIFNVGLEDWSPQESGESKYDLIWNQWCLGHLTDAQLTIYLEKCQKVLNGDGLIIVKENLSTSGADVFDEVDSSVTRYVLSRCNILKARKLNGCRCDQKFRDIFEKAGLRIKKTEIQKGLPKELYPVRIYALVPET